MRRLAFLVTILTLSAASACSSPTEPYDALLRRTQRAELRWAQHRPATYSMQQLRGCECMPETIGPVQLWVEVRAVTERGRTRRHEQIESGHYVASGEPLAAEHPFRSVQGLFALIREAVDARVHRIDVEFDPQFGYPRSIAIDEVEVSADDEINWHTTVTLGILDGPAATEDK